VRRQLFTEMPLNLLTGNFEDPTFFWIVLRVVYSLVRNLSSHTHFCLKLKERKKERKEENKQQFTPCYRFSAV